MTNDVDVFQFLALRSPEVLTPARSRWPYVRDCYYAPREGLPPLSSHFTPPPTLSLERTPGPHDVDLFSPESISPIGRALADLIFRQQASVEAIVLAIENQLVAGLLYGDAGVQTPPIIATVSTARAVGAAEAAILKYAGSRTTYLRGQLLHVLPASLGDASIPLAAGLDRLAAALSRHALEAPQTTTELRDWFGSLIDGARRALRLDDDTRLLADVVFNPQGSYEAAFMMTRRLLFDVLYGLYILRRRETVDLEPFITGLAVCHALERLAIGELLTRAVDAGAFPSRLAALAHTLDARLTEIDFTRGDARAQLEALELIGPLTPAALTETLNAKPVVHPLIARLRGSFAPFNTLKPIGVGDLQVVRQSFLGYRKSSISHIETVLDGETKTRTYRSLDRSENSFSTSSSTDSETTKDSQSTTRFELKTEVEDIIKTDIGVTANTSFSYKGNPVVDASLAAGLAVSSSNSSTERNSKNFVNEVLSKATSRIQTKVANQRSQIQLNEVEETSVHSFANPAGSGHISGSYLWLDKIYQGRVYNYGRRMMFEFILPEPAEFYVEARLAAYVAKLDIPPYPMADNAPAPTMPVNSPEEIDEAKFAELAITYDLSRFTFPAPAITGVSLKTLSGELDFQKQNTYDLLHPAVTEAFSAKLADVPGGYDLTSVRLAGSAEFVQLDETNNPDYLNTLDLALDGVPVFHRLDETQKLWPDINSLGAPKRGVATPEINYMSLPAGMRLSGDVRVTIFTKTCTKHSIAITLGFTRSAAMLAGWRNEVYAEIRRQVQAGGDTAAAGDLETRRIAYRKTLDELKAKSINEIIAGRSDTWNDAQVRRELKRQCLTLVAREFDAESVDDLLPGMGGVGTRQTAVDFPVFSITPAVATETEVISQARASFADPDPSRPSFSAIKIDEAARRGRLVQFLEQAFEWPQMSFLFYPYFWARMPKWLQLMDREDIADPQFTEFLQAGSARALLAVRPGYENAVLHFLATREPWSGGASPVIGDPLYLPLYEEIRDRQDDLAGAEPVGAPWEFSLPTSLIYLESGAYPLPMEYAEPQPTP
ncbi:MAG: hypothetical protein J7521_04150 [Caulobacter sp.]|nr:hypothetical protein [Caulobacter sp.]